MFGLRVDLLPTDNHILLALPPSLETHPFLPTSPKLIIKIGETLGGFTIALSRVGSMSLCLKMSECSGWVPLSFVQRSLEAVPRHMYLKTARSVTISIPPTVPGITWSLWLKNFALATQLSVRALLAKVVLDALMRTNEDSLPICPRLQRIGFYSVGSGTLPVDSKLITKLFLFRVATGFSLQRVTVMERGVIRDFKSPAWLDGILGSGIN